MLGIPDAVITKPLRLPGQFDREGDGRSGGAAGFNRGQIKKGKRTSRHAESPMFGSLASACSQHYFNRGSIVVCPRSGSWIVGYDGEVDRGTFVVRSETLCQNEGQALRGIQKKLGNRAVNLPGEQRCGNETVGPSKVTRLSRERCETAINAPTCSSAGFQEARLSYERRLNSSGSGLHEPTGIPVWTTTDGMSVAHALIVVA